MTSARDDERLRASSALRRVQQSRGLVAPADALHRVAACPRCGSVAVEVSALAEWLTPGGHGAPPVDGVDALAEALSGAFEEAVACEGCEEGAARPALVRYFHAMGRADLVVERADAGRSLRRMFHDGSEEALAGDDEGSFRAAFGRPLTLRPLWREALASLGRTESLVEPGHRLVVASHPSEVAASGASALVVGVSAEAIAAPAWAWLRDALARGEHVTRCLAAVFDVEALRAALARHLARASVELVGATDDPRWSALRGEVALPVDQRAVARELVTLDLPLSSGVMRAAAELDHRLTTAAGYVSAARARRPSSPLVVRGSRLFAEDGGHGHIDLAAAPFEAGLDDALLERDLRALLDEGAPWADPTRVCPCGASRLVVSRAVPRAALSTWHDEGRDAVVLRVFGDAGERSVVEALTLECDRHREPAARATLDAWAWGGHRLTERLASDRAWVTFRVRVAVRRDGAGRAGILAQGADLAGVALHPDWVRGLLDAAMPGGRHEVHVVEAWSPHSLIAYHRGFDAETRALLVGVDAMLDPLAWPRGDDALIRAEVVSDGVARGRFERIDDDAPTATV